jgi:hypothetical protein
MTEKLSEKAARIMELFTFSTVASESHDRDKTLEHEHLSAAEQHLPWRQSREPTL